MSEQDDAINPEEYPKMYKEASVPFAKLVDMTPMSNNKIDPSTIDQEAVGILVASISGMCALTWEGQPDLTDNDVMEALVKIRMDLDGHRKRGSLSYLIGKAMKAVLVIRKREGKPDLTVGEIVHGICNAMSMVSMHMKMSATWVVEDGDGPKIMDDGTVIGPKFTAVNVDKQAFLKAARANFIGPDYVEFEGKRIYRSDL